MKQSQVETWVKLNSHYFKKKHLDFIEEQLTKMDEDKLLHLQAFPFIRPLKLLSIAMFLNCDYFWIKFEILGIFKMFVTLFVISLMIEDGSLGLGGFMFLVIWWFIDVITAKSRAKNYNFDQFTNFVSFINSSSVER